MGEKGNGRKQGGADKPIPGTGKRSIGAEGAVERRKRMEEERRWEGRGERKGPVVLKVHKRK